MTDILIDWSPGEARIAVVAEGELVDFAIWRPAFPDGLGDIHHLKITSCAPAMKGGFAHLPSGEACFVSGKCVEGAHVVAQVTRAAQGGKGPRLSLLPEEPGKTFPPDMTPGLTPLEEMAVRYPDASLYIDHPSPAARMPKHLRARVQRVSRAFDAEIADQCAALTNVSALLGDGMSARFTPTPALFAIDLDDAATHDARAQFSRNVTSFTALAKQVVSRNVNGVVLIDPAGVPTRKRAALVPYLQAAFSADPLKPHGFGTTPSGLMEFTRPRRRPPLHEQLASPQAIGLGALRDLSRMSNPEPKMRDCRLYAAPPVITALEQDPDALAETSRELGFPLRLAIAPDYPVCKWSFT